MSLIIVKISNRLYETNYRLNLLDGVQLRPLLWKVCWNILYKSRRMYFNVGGILKHESTPSFQDVLVELRLHYWAIGHSYFIYIEHGYTYAILLPSNVPFLWGRILWMS